MLRYVVEGASVEVGGSGGGSKPLKRKLCCISLCYTVKGKRYALDVGYECSRYKEKYKLLCFFAVLIDC